MEDDEDDLYGAIGAHATTQYKVLYNDNGQSVVKHERDEQDQEEGEAEGEEADQYSDSVCTLEIICLATKKLIRIRT